MREDVDFTKDRQFFIEKSARLISGQRADDYGDATKNFTRVAKIWSSILDVDVTPEQVASCMIGLKLARLSNQKGHEDSWVDIIGYAALGGEASQK